MNVTSIAAEAELAELAKELNDEMTRAVLPVTIIVGIEVVFGFFGNLVVIYVFWFHYKMCTFRYFVLSLAVVDITCCLTTVPGEMVTQLNWFAYPVREMCKTKSFFNVFTVSAEALCLLTIAVDRYRKVCRPFGWQIKPHVAKHLCGIFYVVALTIALPTPFLWGLRSQKKEYKHRNITVTLCEKDEQFEKTNYPIVYISTVMAIVILLLILMFIQYVFVAMTLLRERRHRVGSGLPMANAATNTTFSPTCASASPDRGQDNRATVNVSATTEVNDTTGEASTATGDDSDMSESNKEQHESPNRDARGRVTCSNRSTLSRRVRRKTLIMFILTVAFIFTTLLYFVLLTIIASPKDILQYLTDAQKAAYFFFLRLYFINYVINPIVYGLLDPQFKSALKKLKTSITNKFNS